MSERSQPRYPVFVPSKGRSDPSRALTIRALERDSVPYRVVVEPPQYEAYLQLVKDERKILVTPFQDLGLGAIPVRNWIRDFAEREGYEKHHQYDDNIVEFRRLWRGRRIPCHAGVAIRVVEDLTDRYLNVGLSGLNYQMFVTAETPVPFYVNVHVYSATLINHAMPYRWNLRYNDDTDICLQALTGGWCTILVNAFMANKMRTMTMRGGMTDDFYAINRDGSAADGTVSSGGGRSSDTFGRFEMARMLERKWPGLVRTSRRFDRYQHTVNWGAFRGLRPKLRDGVDLSSMPDVDEYGMTLRAVREPKNPAVRQLLEEGVA